MVCAMPFHLLFDLFQVRLLLLRASGHVSSGRPCCSWAGLDVTGLIGGGVGDTHTRGVHPPLALTRGISDVMLL